MIIKYYCRYCKEVTNHNVLHSTFDLPEKNFSLLKCLRDQESAFNVEFSKEEIKPSDTSRRVSDVLANNEE